MSGIRYEWVILTVACRSLANTFVKAFGRHVPHSLALVLIFVLVIVKTVYYLTRFLTTVQVGGCDRRPPGGAMYSSSLVMGGLQNSPQSRYQAHHQQQHQQMAYQPTPQTPQPLNEQHSQVHGRSHV